MASEVTLDCVVCGTRSHALVLRDVDWILGLVEGEFTYWRCSGCSTVVQEPMLDDATLARAYGTYHQPLDAGGPLVRALEVVKQREADLLVRDSDVRRPVVEIGCGSGAFLRRLGRAGWQAERWGVEPEGDIAARTSAALSIRVDKASAETFDVEPDGVGTAVLRHVIEHVRDPGQVLDRLHEAIEPHGTLYLCTPDSRALGRFVRGKRWPGWDPPRHLHVFNAQAVRALVRQHGFEPVRERWFWAPDFWTARPVLYPLAAAAAGVEVLAKRSPLYALTARRTSD